MANIFNIQNRIVLITGASRGIGRALALGFRNAGAIVYGTGSRPESVAWMQGENINGRVADLTDHESTPQLIREIIKKEGRLDCLINNAGISEMIPASQFTEERMETMLDINFKAVFRNCQAYYKAQRRAGGNIINISSVLGLFGYPLASIYSATKAAVIQITRSLAVEWAGASFRINAICPGFIDTDMTERLQSRPLLFEKIKNDIPMKRMGRPEEITGAAIFLAGVSSSYMTGQIIVLDGGMTAG